MFNRRNFIKLTSLATVGGLALRGNTSIFGQTSKDYFPIPTEILSQSAHLFKAETFGPLINTHFMMEGNDMTSVSLRLVEVVELNSKKAISNRFPTEGFSLIFEVEGKNELEDRIYEVSHPELGTFSMFVSTVGRSGKRYQAVFSRVYF